MNSFGNRAIAASAGTGKTWTLAHRYLALLAAGVDPDRICALTFSRKAAGEIFETVVGRLCAAADDAAERRNTCRSLAGQAAGVAVPADAAACVRLLRRLLDRSHRLRIGTLDSFLLGIVRAFPLELGIPPDTRPMDNEGGEAAARRQALLARIFDPGRGAAGPGGSGAALLEAFRQATYVGEAKSLARRLDSLIAGYYELYRQHAGKTWGGGADRIWPAAARWWESAGARPEDNAWIEALRQSLGAKPGEACARIAAAAAGYTSEKSWPSGLSQTVLRQLLSAAPVSTPPSLTYSLKAYSLQPSLWLPLRASLANLVAVELGRSLRQTAGLRLLLEQYDALHREAQAADGGLTFSDLSRLLAEPFHQPSRDAAAADKLYVDYRLDGRLDHWLLDEFQDTSDDQWGAIANLIDEVVQDPARSFFYVGDTKQSIYGWRSGNWRLFGRVAEACGIREPDRLDRCHRSLPAIVETVNAVFGGLPSWQPANGAANGPHPRAVEAFVGREWPTHLPAAAAADGEGFAALLEYGTNGRTDEQNEGDEGGDDPAQYEAIARILRDTRAAGLAQGVAVLVRGNAQGRRCADVLRRRLPGIPVVHEGVGGIADNPVVTLLLALVRAAAHPADTLARLHVAMSPLAAPASASSLLSLPLLSAIHDLGFAGALRPWGDRLALRPDDAFGRQRLREFLAAAEEFDASGSRDADAFEDFIRAYQVRAQAAAGAVRVMTIHQAKGLGFDAVFVPFDPQARSFGDVRGLPLLRSDCGADEPSPGGWVLQMPKREALEAAGGAPRAALEAARGEANFEQLCVLYVALTRAKRALYLLVPAPPARTEAVRDADLLRERLAADGPAAEMHGLRVLYRKGDADWLPRRRPAPAAAAAAPPAALAVPFAPGVRRREPSKEQAEGRSLPARWLFGEEAGDVPAFGAALHRLFQRIEWIEDADIEAIVDAWRREAVESAAVRRDAAAQFRRCVQSADARACLGRPAGAAACEVWREAPFSFVREGAAGPEIVSGRFDRLVIERGGDGRAAAATVVDFKSNRVQSDAGLAEAAAGYAGQMRDYAAAAGRLLGLRPEQVKTLILFTRANRVWQV